MSAISLPVRCGADTPWNLDAIVNDGRADGAQALGPGILVFVKYPTAHCDVTDQGVLEKNI